MTNPLKIFISAGEESGDVLGAPLIKALKSQYRGDVHFIGIGGHRMAESGLHSLFPMEDLSVMGVAEILPRLSLLLKRIDQTAKFIAHEQPDIVITIDSPDFSKRVVKRYRKKYMRKNASPRFFHYVAPTVWAWRPKRAEKMAGLYDGVMCLFPFEPPYFEKEGMAASFVGHPVLQSGYDSASGQSFRRAHDLDDDVKIIGFLPGSRRGEIKRMGPVLIESLNEYLNAQKDKNIAVLCATLPHLREDIADLLSSLPCKTTITDDRSQKFDAFATMDMALATSGTVGLELAVCNIPHVIAYKLNPLTYQIVKRLITVKYAHLANILLDAPIVPEFIQNDCTPSKIAAGLNAAKNMRQQEAFSKVRLLLEGESKAPPAEQAAQFILKN